MHFEQCNAMQCNATKNGNRKLKQTSLITKDYYFIRQLYAFLQFMIQFALFMSQNAHFVYILCNLLFWHNFKAKVGINIYFAFICKYQMRYFRINCMRLLKQNYIQMCVCVWLENNSLHDMLVCA